MSTASSEKRPFFQSPRKRRLTLWVGSAVLLGAIAVGVSVYLGQTAETTADASPASGPAQIESPQKAAPLDPAARRVASRFLATAVARRNLAEAWELATPEVRAGVTRAQWLRGELPVAPFPVDVAKSLYQVDASYEDKALLTVFVQPRKGSGTEKGSVYKVTVVKQGFGEGARWIVSYCQPYAPPAIEVNPVS